MRNHPGKGRIAALFGLASLALAALAVSPHPAVDKLGPRILAAARGASEALRDLGAIGFAIVLGGGTALIILFVLLSSQDSADGQVERKPRRTGRIRSTLLGAAILMALFVAFQKFAAKPSAGDEQDPMAPQGSEPAAYSSYSGELPAYEKAGERIGFLDPRLQVAIALGAALLVGGGLALVLIPRRKRGLPAFPSGLLPEPTALESAARGAAITARRRLELGDAVRDSIVDCYVAMCGIFAGTMDGRNIQGDNLTPREFADVLAAFGADEREIRALTSIFEKARYSDEECGDADREGAIAALLALEARYTATAP